MVCWGEPHNRTTDQDPDDILLPRSEEPDLLIRGNTLQSINIPSGTSFVIKPIGQH